MFSMGVGVLMLMGLGFTIVALPVAILYIVFKGLSGLFWVVGAVFGFLGRTLGGALGGLAKGIGGLLGGVVGVVRHLFRFGRGMIGDGLRLVGGVLTAVFFVPLFLFNLLLLRLRTARHYAGAIEDELAACFLSVYRLGIGHPARLLGLTALTEGFERRIPDVIARAPGMTTEAGAPIKKGDTKTFEGYKILAQLRSGGSGARLYLAQPSQEKRLWLREGGHADPDRVVIKSFALAEGSTLPQIVRESRALEAAKQLGLVLEHELTRHRFHYVMPYVDGDELSVVARRMHDASGPDGLADRHLEHALAYAAQLLDTLDHFHRAGLWHKDIKPSNILVAKGRVHLVDLGLVTPLQSAMTLTTHGTEYFRDPEMVRLAMKGVKVHEVDGVKFDLYSAGAVVYSIVENSFPAHGSLSNVTKRCPEALAWIVRRAMADLQNRYGSAGEMLRDLRVLAAADDPFAVVPADLPSFQGIPFVPEPTRPDPFARPAEIDTGEIEVARAAAKRPRLASEPEVPEPAPATPVAAPVVPRRQRRKRRVQRAMSVAVVLFVAWGIGSLLVTREMRAGRPGGWVQVETLPSLAERERQRRLAEVDAISYALAEYEAERLKARARELESAPADEREFATSSTAAETVLVVSDLPVSEATDELLGRLYEQLAVQDYDVLGLSGGGFGPVDEREDELLPLARVEIGVGLPSDADTADRLQTFVDAHPGVHYLVWLVPGTGARRVDGLIVTPEKVHRLGSPSDGVWRPEAADARQLPRSVTY